MRSVVTLTLNPAIDASTTVDRVVPEDKLRCAPTHYEPGGGGINVARVLHRLGVEARALFTSAGTTGAQLAGLVRAHQVPASTIPVSGETRTNFTVYETSSTQQYRFGAPGPELSEADRERIVDTLWALEPRPGIVVLSGSLPPGAPDDFYARIRKSFPDDLEVVLDSSGAALSAGLKAGGYALVKPNLRELAELSGRELESDAAIVAAARSLVDAGRSRWVVVSLGAGGALGVSADHALMLRAPTVPVQSKVGAGDSMVAGLVHGLATDAPPEAMLQQGVAAGAAAVMTPGSELSRAEDIHRLAPLVQIVSLSS